MPYDIQRAYPDGHVIPVGDNKGKVFYSLTALIPPGNTEAGYPHIFDPFVTGTGGPYWTQQDRAAAPNEAPAGVLLPIRLTNPKARFLVAGGWWINFLDTVEVIDLTDPSSEPTWFNIEPLKYERGVPNAVILPDRSLFFGGGENSAGLVMVPELLDTDTLEWINHDLPEMPPGLGRGYHSTMLLLPSAQILCAGGRVKDGGDSEDDTERRLSIFTPGYLLDGPRPLIIADTPPLEVAYGSTFNITLDGTYPLDSICLMKPASFTHSTDMDQRYIELAFISEETAGTYEVTAPSSTDGPYLAPPGYYMLFVLKAKSESQSGKSSIPSVAKFIKLKFP